MEDFWMDFPFPVPPQTREEYRHFLAIFYNITNPAQMCRIISEGLWRIANMAKHRPVTIFTIGVQLPFHDGVTRYAKLELDYEYQEDRKAVQ